MTLNQICDQHFTFFFSLSFFGHDDRQVDRQNAKPDQKKKRFSLLIAIYFNASSPVLRYDKTRQGHTIWDWHPLKTYQNTMRMHSANNINNNSLNHLKPILTWQSCSLYAIAVCIIIADRHYRLHHRPWDVCVCVEQILSYSADLSLSNVDGVTLNARMPCHDMPLPCNFML